MTVGVTVLVGVLVGVIDGVTVLVGVLVGVGVLVWVGVFVGVLVGVIVGVTVLVGVLVGVIVGVFVGVNVGVTVFVGVGVGVVFSEQITKVAPDNVPLSITAKSWMYSFQDPFEIGGCNPSNIVNSGELPVVNVVGQGAENGIALVTNVLFLNVPEENPFQVVGV